MNGAESLMRTASDLGVDVCFANPGTTELQLVAALDVVPGMRSVLGLFEGVCTGAADGYGRMTGSPALTLLHLGPGFANGIANLHNARRAGTPIVNLIGDHASWHRAFDAPLSSDIVSLATPVSAWLRTATSAKTLAHDTAAAIQASLAPPGQIATLIVPQDCAWDPADATPGPILRPRPAAVSDRALAAATDAVRMGAGCALFLGGPALTAPALRAADRVARHHGCRVLQETFASRVEQGRGIPAIPTLPYFPEQAIEALSGVERLVLVGARDPVAFFGYPDVPSRLAPENCTRIELARTDEDCEGALEALAGAAASEGAAASGAPGDPEPPDPPSGALDVETLGRALASVQPEGAILVNEGATSGFGFGVHAPAAAPHTMLGLTGGAIGQGLPTAVGAAVACPERRVIALQADGSGMYTLQALWTAARESLDLVALICANRSYRILQVELARAGIAEPGQQARRLTDLGRPNLDWVSLARGLGVPGSRAESADALVAELERALATPGPSLIEAVL